MWDSQLPEKKFHFPQEIIMKTISPYLECSQIKIIVASEIRAVFNGYILHSGFYWGRDDGSRSDNWSYNDLHYPSPIYS